MLQKLIIKILIFSALTGCKASLRGEPEYSIDNTRDVLKYSVDAALSDKSIDDALMRDTDGSLRNQIVFARIAEIDFLYYSYERDIGREFRQSGLVSSMTALIAGVGGTLALSEAASRGFSAASAFIAGTNEAFNEKILVDRTIQALTAEMRANRNKQKQLILGQLSKPPRDYPLLAALSDLEAYRAAGTLQGALLSVTESATNNEMLTRRELATQQKVLNLEVVEIEAPKTTPTPAFNDRIKSIIAAILALDDDKAVSLANNPPNNAVAFQQYLSSQGGSFDGIPEIARNTLRDAANTTLGSDDEAGIRAVEKALGIQN